jgi:hypothetical protein
VSKDVGALKEAIADQAEKISDKVDESQKNVLQRVEDLFDRKFMGAIGRMVAAGSVMYGAAIFLQSQGLSTKSIGILAVLAGIALWLIVRFLGNRKANKPGAQI